MKPTIKQKEVIDAVLNVVKFFKSTNDINSPTHICDIDEVISMEELEENITKEEGDVLTIALSNIYNVIRNING